MATGTIEERRKAIDDAIVDFEQATTWVSDQRRTRNFVYLSQIMTLYAGLFSKAASDQDKRDIVEDALYFESRLGQDPTQWGFPDNLVQRLGDPEFLASAKYAGFMKERHKYLPIEEQAQK